MADSGKITQVIGAVLDVKFAGNRLPEINEAIKVPLQDGGELVVEVAQHVLPWEPQTDLSAEWKQLLPESRFPYLLVKIP